MDLKCGVNGSIEVFIARVPVLRGGLNKSVEAPLINASSLVAYREVGCFDRIDEEVVSQ